MYCKKCGQELPNDANVCSNCGEPVVASTQQEFRPIPRENKEYSTVSLVLGICGLFAWFIPLFGYPVGVCGVVFSSKAISKNTNKTIGIIGLVFSIICLVASVINSVLGVLMQM